LSKIFDAINWDDEYVAKVGSEEIEENLSAFADKIKDAHYSQGYRSLMKSLSGDRDTCDGYEHDYQCPICKQGTITYCKETTPGFKSSSFSTCTKCGFSIHQLIDAMRE